MAEKRAYAPAIRPDGLQLDEPRRFQEIFWSSQRLSWVLFSVLIVLFLLGFSGSGGPFAKTSILLPDGASAEFPRVARWDSSEEFTFILPPNSGERVLALDAAFVRAFEVKSVRPQPDWFEAAPEGYRMGFLAARDKQAEVEVFVRPRRPGNAAYGASFEMQPPFQMSTIILP